MECEQFNEVYASLDAQDISEVDFKGFIEHCEAFYKMSTDEFHGWFEMRGCEGNPEQQLWYMIT